VKLWIFGGEERPRPNPPLQAGEGAQLWSDAPASLLPLLAGGGRGEALDLWGQSHSARKALHVDHVHHGCDIAITGDGIRRKYRIDSGEFGGTELQVERTQILIQP